MIEAYDKVLDQLERDIVKTAKCAGCYLKKSSVLLLDLPKIYAARYILLVLLLDS
jgi:hypothetical protein